MFQEGKVKTYNADRGFGFIQVDGEKKDLLFHIKDFPNRNVPPEIGEKIKFRIVEDAAKFKADQIVRLDLKSTPAASTVIGEYEDFPEQNSPRYSSAEKSKISKLITIIGLVIIVVLAVLVYGKYQEYKVQKDQQVQALTLQQQKIVQDQRAALGDIEQQGLSEQGRKNLEKTINAPIQPITSSISVSSPYQCDGRQHCSQMNSRAEAVWFINNCPNTKMDGDGDGDGIPCENDSRWQ